MRHRKILASMIIIISLLILALIIHDKISAQNVYESNTAETVEVLNSELPICENGTITTNIVEETYGYQPDELMGSIYVPKFDLTIPLYMENENDSTNWVLEVGVAMDSYSSYPYGDTATVVYGHRHYDFQALKDIEVGDPIIVSIGESTYLYEVTSTEVVKETEVEKVFTDKNELVLYTCYPFYWGATSSERFVVHAMPVDSISC